jgi:hypothetical protein
MEIGGTLTKAGFSVVSIKNIEIEDLLDLCQLYDELTSNKTEYAILLEIFRAKVEGYRKHLRES